MKEEGMKQITRRHPYNQVTLNKLDIILYFQKVKTLEEIISVDEYLQNLINTGELDIPKPLIHALERLRMVSRSTLLFQKIVTQSARLAALNHAENELVNLLQELDLICPKPERLYLKQVIHTWRNTLELNAKQLIDEMLSEFTENPYIGVGGRPVEGKAFIGRSEILAQIETFWASPGALPTLFVYGHRRMGKTSILRNLNLRRDPKTLLVLLDMQSAGSVDTTAQFYYEIAQEVYDRAKGFGWLTVEDEPDAAAFTATTWEAKNGLDRLFRRLNEIRDERRLILAIDEFELIEERIREERIQPEALNYLRSLTQKYNWLALIFGGLLSIDEMGRDYRNAFFGSSQNVRVSYLSRSEAEKLITQPDPEFTLEYEPALVDELFRLTHGQPYLLQRICWELVNAWNEKFLTDGASTERLLRLSDLEPLLNDNFYRAAEYYFSGVWSQSTADEKIVMRLLTDHKNGLPIAYLQAALPEGFEFENVLKRLRHRDVIIEESGMVRYAAELNRRWIAMNYEEN
jgi:AAA domain